MKFIYINYLLPGSGVERSEVINFKEVIRISYDHEPKIITLDFMRGITREGCILQETFQELIEFLNPKIKESIFFMYLYNEEEFDEYCK